MQAAIAEKELIRFLSPRQALTALWDQDLSGRELLIHHSSLVDGFIENRLIEALGGHPSGISLIALGGYGRRELFPFSDIDLLLLYDEKASGLLEQVTDAVFYPLWDAGLEVGHGVRTVQACLEDMKQDFFFQVALLDARLVCGDKDLFTKLSEKFRKSFDRGTRKTFVQDMMAHRAERHRRCGDHTYLLEPNIKESRGGLRDLQAMFWTGSVLFGLGSPEEFREAGLLTRKEFADLEDAQNHLIIIRNRLHYVSGRKNDRLFFEYQEEIAKKLRLYDSREALGVERFMKKVHTDLQRVAVASDLFFEHVEDVINAVGAKGKTKQLSPGIELLNGKILLRDEELLLRKPYLLFRAFAISASEKIPLHYRSRKLIAALIEKLPERLRSSRRCAKYFLETLKNSTRPQPLIQMLDTGLLGFYIPEFERLRALALHDVYHVNTVDRHIVETVVRLNHLRDKYANLFTGIRDQDVLLLAAFLHDIGKGLGGRHALKGAEMTKSIAGRLSFTPEQKDTLHFLVANHLFLMDNATRRDLEDETLLLKFARHIRDIDRLNMLYLITIADSMATGPNVWTEWKQALVLEIYHKTAHLLEQHELIDPDRITAVEWMREKVFHLLGKQQQELLDILPEDYLLSFTPEAVVRHLRLRQDLSGEKVLIIPEDRGNYWSILLMTRDRTGLLSKICGAFALYNLAILQAQIFTLKDGTVVDVLDTGCEIHRDFHEVDWSRIEKDLQKTLQNKLSLSHRLASKFSRVSGPAHKASIKPRARVVIDNEQSDFYTIIEIYTQDSPCLLYSVTRTLAEFGINIYKAKIGTSGDQVVDVFYVLDDLGERIEDKEFTEEVKNALLYSAQSCLI